VLRYAILNDLDSPDLHPVGLAVERQDRVQVKFVTDYGLRSEFREPYTVREPDGEKLVYGPGTPEYFDHVLLTLSRGFLVSHVGETEALDSLSAAKLFYDEVCTKQPRPRASEYSQQHMRPTPRVATPNTDAGNGNGSARHRRHGPIRTAA
jgi:hypothetical protein